MTDIIKKVVKFGGSAHVILPKKMVGEKVKITKCDIEEVRRYDLKRLNHLLNKDERELQDYYHSSMIYKRRLGSNYETDLRFRIDSMKEKIKKASG